MLVNPSAVLSVIEEAIEFFKVVVVNDLVGVCGTIAMIELLAYFIQCPC